MSAPFAFFLGSVVLVGLTAIGIVVVAIILTRRALSDLSPPLAETRRRA